MPCKIKECSQPNEEPTVGGRSLYCKDRHEAEPVFTLTSIQETDAGARDKAVLSERHRDGAAHYKLQSSRVLFIL